SPQESQTIRAWTAIHIYFAEEWNAAVAGRNTGKALSWRFAHKLFGTGRSTARSRLGSVRGIRDRSIRCGNCGHAGAGRRPVARDIEPRPGVRTQDDSL